MQMDFFRRPRLSGNVLSRLQFATVHGAARRLDADNTSNVPYFPGLTSTTLTILLDGSTPYTVTFTSTSYIAALSAINTALSTHGSASDTDGSISIQTATAGGLGAVEITGGTSISILGFGVLGSTSTGVRSTGGDLLSTPEDRLQNESSTGFPGVREALSIDVVNRAVGRISANTDVLYADMVRDRAILQKITGFTVSSDGTYISLPNNIRTFTGLGLLANTSTKEDLAPFFMIMDAVSRTPAASKPVALVRGTPSGSLPYSNSPGYSDTTGKNVLGLSLAKLSSIAITGIEYGRYISCTGTTFTQTVSVGDYVQIAGATNLTNQNNNGLRWVVEAVVSDLVLEVRPMSQSELALVGTTLLDNQPTVELNGNISGVQSYGTISVYTGTYWQTVGATAPNGLNLVVSPPVPPGSSIQVWVAQPKSIRKEQPADVTESADLLYDGMVTSYRTLPDCIISGFSSSYSSGPDTLTVNPGVIRLDGRLVNHPGKVYTTASSVFGVTSSNIIWYDPLTADLAFGTSISSSRDPADYLAIPTTSLLTIAQTIVNGSAITGLTNLVRLEALQSRSITVGSGGQFSTLEGALAYILAWSTAKTDGTSAAGAYSHWDIVLVSDYTLSSGVTISCPSLRISGATPSTKLTFGTGAFLDAVNMTEIVIENLQIDCPSTGGHFVFLDGSVRTNVVLRNLYQSTISSGAFDSLVQHSSVQPLNVLIDRCNVNILFGIVIATPAVTNVLNSVFTFVASTTAVPLSCFNSALSTSNTWTGTYLRIEGCTFTGMIPSTNSPTTFAYPMLVNATGVNSSIMIKGNTFTFITLPITNGVAANLYVDNSNPQLVVIEGNWIGTNGTPCHQAISSQSLSSFVTGNAIYCLPEFGGVGVSAENVISNTIAFFAGDAGQANNIGVQANMNATGNYIHGSADIMLEIVQNDGMAIGNHIQASFPTSPTAPTSILLLNGSGQIASGNMVNGATTVGSCNLIYVTGANSVVSGNVISTGANNVGIMVNGDNCSVTGNSISQGSAFATGIYIENADSAVISGNTVKGTSDFAVYFNGTSPVVFTGNYFGGEISLIPNGANLLFTGNYVTGSAEFLGSSGAETSTITGNHFLADVAIETDAVIMTCNKFYTNVSIGVPSSTGTYRITECQFLGIGTTYTLTFQHACGNVNLSNCYIASMVDTTDTTGNGDFRAIGCDFTNTTHISGPIPYAVYLKDFTNVFLSDCTFSGDVYADNISSDYLTISGCNFAGLLNCGFANTGGEIQISNSVFAKEITYDNAGSQDFLMQNCEFTYLNLSVETGIFNLSGCVGQTVDLANGGTTVNISGNVLTAGNLISSSAQNCLNLGMFSGQVTSINNNIFIAYNLLNSTSGQIGECIFLLTEATYRALSIVGNKLFMTDNVSASGSGTFSCLSILFGDVSLLLLSSNQWYFPANRSSYTFHWVGLTTVASGIVGIMFTGNMAFFGAYPISGSETLSTATLGGNIVGQGVLEVYNTAGVGLTLS